MMPPTPNTNGSVRSGDDAPLLRVAQMNLLQPNDEHAATLEAALATDADVLSFQEVSPAWADALADCLAARYPYSCVVPGTNCYGIALFSRIRFEDAHVFHLSGTPAIDATLRTASGTVRVLCVHATSPGDYSNFRERNEQLALLAPLIAISDLPTVLIGDLNTVSWDHAFRKLCACAGLKERSCDVTATWPSFFGFACIPIDHVLTSDELHVSALSTFAIPGSDHRGVVAQLVRAG